MKRRITILATYALWTVMFLAGCETDEPAGEIRKNGRVVLAITAGTDELSPARTRGGQTERMAKVWYAIADAKGDVFTPSHHSLGPDLSSLTIENLGYGEYTIVILATTASAGDGEVAFPKHLNDAWLSNTTAGVPLDRSWFHKRIDISIGKDQLSQEHKVVLDRCVGRVDIDLKFASPYMKRFIRSAKVTLDGGNAVYTTMNAAGEYDGEGEVREYEVAGKYSFYCLPSTGTLSGKVEIVSALEDGQTEKTFTRSYRFSDCRIEAGRVSHISIGYDHPDNSSGKIYLREEDMHAFGVDTMFLADEPQEVFYDTSKRSFYVNEPLNVSISEEGDLVMRFFAPVTLHDVTVLCRFNKASTEYLELAYLETVPPFMEAKLPIPVTTSECTFRTSSGRRINLPAMPGLKQEDVSIRLRSDDPFLKMTEKIESRWWIRYGKYSADNPNPGYWRHMNPLLCRHASALVLNMAYMFSTEEFNTAMEAYDGLLLDNGRNPINLDNLRERIRNHSGLSMGCVSGVGGLGGGVTYGLAPYCYTENYYDFNEGGPAHTYARNALFHEFGHCIGYNHNSTMTYGDQWTVLCATTFVSLGRENKLPVSSKNTIGNLPM